MLDRLRTWRRKRWCGFSPKAECDIDLPDASLTAAQELPFTSNRERAHPIECEDYPCEAWDEREHASSLYAVANTPLSANNLMVLIREWPFRLIWAMRVANQLPLDEVESECRINN
jgi:hypothetical protein